VAICVVDMSGLPDQLEALQVRSRADLDQLLTLQPGQAKRLLQQLRITEVNQVALDLLNLACTEQAWPLRRKVLERGGRQSDTETGRAVYVQPSEGRHDAGRSA
jgi:hypothetical protein